MRKAIYNVALLLTAPTAAFVLAGAAAYVALFAPFALCAWVLGYPGRIALGHEITSCLCGMLAAGSVAFSCWRDAIKSF